MAFGNGGSDDVAPAHDNDTWYRHVVIPRLIKNDGSVHRNFFKVFAPPQQERPWTMEISGRMLSKSNDIRSRAESAAAKVAATGKIARFYGVIYSSVSNVRTFASGQYDVYEEPRPSDLAHANLVDNVKPLPLKSNGRFDWDVDGAMEKLKNLATLFRAETEDNLSDFESLRIS